MFEHGIQGIIESYRRRGAAVPANYLASALEITEAELEAPAPAAGAHVRISRGPEAKTQFESLGEFLSVARFSPNDQRLAYVDISDMRGEQRTDDGASGGFAIPVQFRKELLQVSPTQAIMRPNAMVIPAGSPPDADMIIPALDQSAATNMYGGVTVGWIGEGGLKPNTDSKIREVTLRPQEIAGTIVTTDKLLRNWQGAGSTFGGLLQAALIAAEDVAFLTGDGIAKPLGVLNATASGVVNRETAGEITYNDVLAMDEILIGNDPTAFWVTTKRQKTWLRQLKNPAGYFIWKESAIDGGLPTLLGHPVKISDRLPTAGNRGDLMLIDPTKYVIKDGSGPFVAFSEHVFFQNNKTMIKAFTNVDGQPWMKGPVKTENGELQYPFVILN